MTSDIRKCHLQQSPALMLLTPWEKTYPQPKANPGPLQKDHNTNSGFFSPSIVKDFRTLIASLSGESEQPSHFLHTFSIVSSIASTNSPVKVLSADRFHGHDIRSVEQEFFLDFLSSIFLFHLLLLPDENEGGENVSHGRKGEKRFFKQIKQLCKCSCQCQLDEVSSLLSPLRRQDKLAAWWMRWALYWYHCSAILDHSGFTQGM